MSAHGQAAGLGEHAKLNPVRQRVARQLVRGVRRRRWRGGAARGDRLPDENQHHGRQRPRISCGEERAHGF